jgi:hypothetical protein
MIPLYESGPFYGGIGLPHKHAGVSSEANATAPVTTLAAPRRKAKRRSQATGVLL